MAGWNETNFSCAHGLDHCSGGSRSPLTGRQGVARDARGQRLTYNADDEGYVRTGAPVQFTEDCRVTTGRTLTFFGTAGKLIVDGNQATRTVTKGGGKCTPPPQ